jgi:hypothetical protein
MFACVIACLYGQKKKDPKERTLLAIRSERTSVEIYILRKNKKSKIILNQTYCKGSKSS